MNIEVLAALQTAKGTAKTDTMAKLSATDYSVIPSVDKKVSEAYISEMLNKDSGKTTIYKNNIEIDVNILSIVLNESNGTKTSTIRTELVKRNITTGGGEAEKSIKVITLVYEYLPIKLNTKNRLENPLGFVVTSYRVDEEITTQKEKTE